MERRQFLIDSAASLDTSAIPNACFLQKVYPQRGKYDGDENAEVSIVFHQTT
jgi:hypothetical protein